MHGGNRSETTPFALSWITHPALPSTRLGLCRCPGIGTPLTDDAACLADDLDHLASLGIHQIVSLIGEEERHLLGVAALPAMSESRALQWREWPITDFAAPDPDKSRAFASFIAGLADELMAGKRIAVHCRAGLGRSGLVAASILIQLGVTADEAIACVRQCRPATIETAAQETFIKAFHPGSPDIM